MRLIACHIENFGKLSDFRMEFGQGLNVIHEANAWGKSTLAAFLRVMFYGFDPKREPGAFDKERNIFRPWQGGPYGGEVDFEHGGKSYRISRTFGRTEKTDVFHLYDLGTNLECHDFSSQIGGEIFGLDAASFKRSVFIAQNDCECGSTDAINAKLGNLAENTNDINNFESAQKRIHDRMNRLSPDRATGSMKKRTNRITLLSEELRGFDAAEKSAEEIAERLEEKQKQRRELSEIRSQYAQALKLASEESRRESLQASYDGIVRELEEKRAALEQYGASFPKRVPDDDEFQEKNRQVHLLGVLKTTLYNIGLTEEEEEQYRELQELFSAGQPTQEEFGAVEESLDALARCKDERAQLETKMTYYEAMAIKKEEASPAVGKRTGMLVFGMFLAVLGAAGIAASVLLAVLQNDKPIVLGVISGALLVIAAALFAARANIRAKEKRRAVIQVQKREEERRRLQEPVDELHAQLSRVVGQTEKLNRELSAFLERFHIVCDADVVRNRIYELRNRAQIYDQLRARAQRSESVKEDCGQTREALLAFGEECGISFGEDIAANISNLQMRAAEYRLARGAYEEALAKKRSFEEAHPAEELASTEKCPYSLDELNRMIREVDERIEEVRGTIAQYSHQMEDLQEQLDTRDEKEQQLAICRKEQESEGHAYEILSLTQEYLQRAKEQFAARYLGPIENGFRKYYGMLSGDTAEEWMVGSDIAVKLKEQGELRELKWLSAGCQDLLGICMRFALVDAMYPQEKPFLVLDDPYVNMDEDKVRRGNELLLQISGEYQIVYFTCHGSRVANGY